IRGSGSVVEHLLAKEKVAGSNPVFRSRKTAGPMDRLFYFSADVVDRLNERLNILKERGGDPVRYPLRPGDENNRQDLHPPTTCRKATLTADMIPYPAASNTD